MFKIRPDQIQEIETSRRARFHHELLALLRIQIPEQVRLYDDAALLKKIVAGHERARSFGIESERGVSRFIGLQLITSPPFDELPQVRDYLERSDIDGTDKMDFIFRDFERLALLRTLGHKL